MFAFAARTSNGRFRFLLVRSRSLFIDLLAHRNAFALLSENVHPETRLWGSIPQNDSMAGIVNSGMRLPAEWEDVWRRG
jgi:hypothetical protein